MQEVSIYLYLTVFLFYQYKKLKGICITLYQTPSDAC